MPITDLQKTHLRQSQLIIQSIYLIYVDKYHQAIQKLQKAIWFQQNNANLYFLYSLCLYWIKDYRKSDYFLQTAIKMNPLCQIYQLPDRQAIQKIKNVTNNAIKYEKQLINSKTLSVSRWYQYTILYHQQTDYHKVQQIYKRLFQKYPQVYNIKTHAFLGNYANLLYDIGKYDQAIQKYQIQILKDPTQMRFFSNCSMLYTIVGNYVKAEEYIKIALNRLPTRPNFLLNYSNILAKTNRFQEAIQKVLLALQRQATDPIFQLKYSTVLLMQSDIITQQKQAIIANNLITSNKIFKTCIQTNSTAKANSNKRILSMKNIICLKLFTDILLSYCKIKIKWPEMKQVIDIISHYLIVGQATKLDLQNKLANIFKKEYQQLSKQQQIIKYQESKRNLKNQFGQQKKPKQISIQKQIPQTYDMSTQTDIIQSQDYDKLQFDSISNINQQYIQKEDKLQIQQKQEQVQSKLISLWKFVNKFYDRLNKIIQQPKMKRIAKNKVVIKKAQDPLDGLFD